MQSFLDVVDILPTFSSLTCLFAVKGLRRCAKVEENWPFTC